MADKKDGYSIEEFHIEGDYKEQFSKLIMEKYKDAKITQRQLRSINKHYTIFYNKDLNGIKTALKFLQEDDYLKPIQELFTGYYQKHQNDTDFRAKVTEEKEKQSKDQLEELIGKLMSGHHLSDYSLKDELPKIGDKTRDKQWKISITNISPKQQLIKIIEACQILIQDTKPSDKKNIEIDLLADLGDENEFLCIISQRPILARIILSIFNDLNQGLLLELLFEDQIALILYDLFDPSDQLFIQTLEKLCDLQTRLEFNLEQAKLFPTPQAFFQYQWRKLIQYENKIFDYIFNQNRRLPIAMTYHLWYDFDTFESKNIELQKLPVRYLDYLVRAGYLERNFQLVNRDNKLRVTAFDLQQTKINPAIPEDWKVGTNSDIPFNQLICATNLINDIEAQNLALTGRFIIQLTLDGMTRKEAKSEDTIQLITAKKQTMDVIKQVRFTSEVLHRLFNLKEEILIYEKIVQSAKNNIIDFNPHAVIEYTVPSQEIYYLNGIYSQQGKEDQMKEYTKITQNLKIKNMTLELNRNIRYKALNVLNNYLQQSQSSIFTDFNQAVIIYIQGLQLLAKQYNQSLTNITSQLQEFIFIASQQEYTKEQDKLTEEQQQQCLLAIEQATKNLKSLGNQFLKEDDNVIQDTLVRITNMISQIIATITNLMEDMKSFRIQAFNYQVRSEEIVRINSKLSQDNQQELNNFNMQILYSKLILQIQIQNSSQLFNSFIIPSFKQIQTVSDTMINMMIKQKISAAITLGQQLDITKNETYNEVISGLKEIAKLKESNIKSEYQEYNYDIQMIE